MASEDLYERLIAAMVAISGEHPGRRAVHAKACWARGTFTATPRLTALSTAAPFGGDGVDALVRFSNASGNPEGHDASRDGRGIAVKLDPGGAGETDILATTAPCFVARTPEEFLELLEARRPDPDSGEPDMEKLGAYLGAHPEAQAAIQSVIGTEPPASFATLTYFSPHTFELVDADGDATPVRWRWRPEAGEERIPDDEARDRGRDYLQEEVAERLRAGIVAFDFVIQLADDSDPLDDPTAIWPDERELVDAGRLEVTELIDDPETSDDIHVFDPTRIVEGIRLSDDPVLHARPKAYSVSAYKRWEGGP